MHPPIVVNVAPEYTPEEGTTLDALTAALEFAEIPASLIQGEAPDCTPMPNARFIRSIVGWEFDGPAPVDLVVLNDGRVIGINGECAVLYPSLEAFEASGDGALFDASGCPSLSLL
jgi:hypothetical protein